MLWNEDVEHENSRNTRGDQSRKRREGRAANQKGILLNRGYGVAGNHSDTLLTSTCFTEFANSMAGKIMTGVSVGFGFSSCNE